MKKKTTKQDYLDADVVATWLKKVNNVELAACVAKASRRLDGRGVVYVGLTNSKPSNMYYLQLSKLQSPKAKTHFDEFSLPKLIDLCSKYDLENSMVVCVAQNTRIAVACIEANIEAATVPYPNLMLVQY